MSRALRDDPRDMSEARFMETFGGLYEDSPQFVAALWRRGDLTTDVERFAAALAAVVDAADETDRLELIRAHPDLAGRAALADELTDDSRDEQASAGLDRCSPEELARFHALNGRYRDKFGFPFVMAVRGATRHDILDAFEKRLANDRATELKRALAEVHRIARLRLEALAADG